MDAATKYQPKPRSFIVEYKHDYRPDMGLHWRCHFKGDGYWCAGGQYHSFPTAAAATVAGLNWVETGR